MIIIITSVYQFHARIPLEHEELNYENIIEIRVSQKNALFPPVCSIAIELCLVAI